MRTDFLKVGRNYLVHDSNNYEAIFEIRILEKSSLCIRIQYMESGIKKWVRNSFFDDNNLRKIYVIEELDIIKEEEEKDDSIKEIKILPGIVLKFKSC